MLRKPLSEKCSSEHIKGNLFNLEEKTSPKLRNYRAKIQNSSQKKLFPSEKPFSSWTYSAEVGFSFDNAAEKTLQNFDFFTQSPETFVQYVFFHNVCFSSKNSIWKRVNSFGNAVKKFLPIDRRYLSRPPQMFAELNVFQ